MAQDPPTLPQSWCSSAYVTRRIAGETIVVPIRAEAAQLDSVYVFNEVGARIWELLEAGRTEDAVVATLTREFAVDVERSRADLLSFVEVLRQAGLVEQGAGA